jgi:hypothetical protein
MSYIEVRRINTLEKEEVFMKKIRLKLVKKGSLTKYERGEFLSY